MKAGGGTMTAPRRASFSLSLIVILAPASGVSAAPTWVRNYPSSLYALSPVPVGDGYALLGSLGGVTPIPFGIGPFGDVRWATAIQSVDGANSFPNGLVRTTSGVAFIGDSTAGLVPLQVRMDDRGASQAGYSISGTSSSVYDVAAMADGGYAIVMSGSDLVRFDPDGAILWRRQLSPVIPSPKIRGLPDGGLLVTSISLRPAGGAVIRLDAAGAVLWSHQFPDTYHYSLAIGTQDGGVVVGSRRKDRPSTGG